MGISQLLVGKANVAGRLLQLLVVMCLPEATASAAGDKRHIIFALIDGESSALHSLVYAVWRGQGQQAFGSLAPLTLAA